MLHVVYRIKRMVGRPWWEKELIEKLELKGRVGQSFFVLFEVG